MKILQIATVLALCGLAHADSRFKGTSDFNDPTEPKVEAKWGRIVERWSATQGSESVESFLYIADLSGDERYRRATLLINTTSKSGKRVSNVNEVLLDCGKRYFIDVKSFDYNEHGGKGKVVVDKSNPFMVQWNQLTGSEGWFKFMCAPGATKREDAQVAVQFSKIRELERQRVEVCESEVKRMFSLKTKNSRTGALEEREIFQLYVINHVGEKSDKRFGNDFLTKGSVKYFLRVNGRRGDDLQEIGIDCVTYSSTAKLKGVHLRDRFK